MEPSWGLTILPANRKSATGKDFGWIAEEGGVFFGIRDND